MIVGMPEQRKRGGRPKKAGAYYKARLDDASRRRVKQWAEAQHLPVAEALAVLANVALDHLEPGDADTEDEMEGAA
ncbi:MAG TPA: hypothetical protein VHV82_06900 [Sporichthyaceae bacterium]|jgi:hypothetical protein|nr:hypothetical protein [Sporichthyaceae bacterium]